MAFEVVFTKKSELDFDSILQYIHSEFGSIAAIRFKDLTIEFASILETFPETWKFGTCRKEYSCFCNS